jgi:hypothetical protein
MDLIYLAQNWNRWRALVNEVMNFRVPYNAGNVYTRSLQSITLDTVFSTISSASSPTSQRMLRPLQIRNT